MEPLKISLLLVLILLATCAWPVTALERESFGFGQTRPSVPSSPDLVTERRSLGDDSAASSLIRTLLPSRSAGDARGDGDSKMAHLLRRYVLWRALFALMLLRISVLTYLCHVHWPYCKMKDGKWTGAGTTI